MSTQLLVFGAIAFLAIGFTAGCLATITLGARLISDHVSGRFARREKPEPDDEPEISPAATAASKYPGTRL